MKRFHIAILLSVLAVAVVAGLKVGAQALPVYANQSLISHQNIAASTASNYTATGFTGVVDCRKQAKVTFSFVSTNTLDQVGTGAIIAYVQRSVDGTYYDTNLTAISIAPVGKNVSVVTTNIDTYGAGYMRFSYITNAAGGSTNVGDLNVSYGIKIGAP